MSRIFSVPRVILDFEQYEEFIGAAWAKFSMLIYASPNLSFSDSVFLSLFCLGINIDADLCLDVTTGGRFTHKPKIEQVKFLENFLERHTSSVMKTRTLHAKVMSSAEESSLVEFKPIPFLDSTLEPPPKP
jgi:hypothetical protein